VLSYTDTKRARVLRTARERAGPEGRVGTDVRILRVSSTRVKEMLSRRLEISMCDWLGWGGTTSSLGLGCEVSAGFAGSFGLVTGACLGPTMTLGYDFAVLPFLLVFVTSLCMGVSVTRPGLCWGSVGGAALTTQPPDNMVPTSPRSSCPADGPPWFAFGAAERPVVQPPCCIQQVLTQQELPST